MVTPTGGPQRHSLGSRRIASKWFWTASSVVIARAFSSCATVTLHSPTHRIFAVDGEFRRAAAGMTSLGRDETDSPSGCAAGALPISHSLWDGRVGPGGVEQRHAVLDRRGRPAASRLPG
jgi:hypothetical protein